MYVVSAMPLEKKAHTDVLSFFSTEKIAPGVIAKGSWRKKEILILVTECSPLSKEKLTIKQSGFALKKIKTVIGPSPLSKEFLHTVESYAKEYGSSARVLFDTLVPSKLLSENISVLKKVNKKLFAPKIIVGTLDFRLETYRKSISEEARVLFVVPTERDAKVLSQKMKERQFRNPVLINGKTASYEEAATYITTPAGLGYPFQNLDLIVIEFENSHLYTLRNTIHADLFAYKLSKELQVPLWRGAPVPSLFTVKQLYDEKIEIVQQKDNSLTTLIVTPEDKKKTFDKTILKEIETALAQNKKIFCFAVRRGYAEVTICNDCKTLLRCKNCSRPLVLHRQNEKSWYLCHHCGSQEDTLRKCESCESWNLRPLGMGTDIVYEALRTHFPSAPLYKIDSDTTTTEKKVKETIDSFNKTGGILIGTEMALRQLDEATVALSIIASFDSLFSLPHFSIEERMLEILYLLKEKTKETLLVQTLLPDETLFDAWTKNAVPQFMKSLLTDREELGYPPCGAVWVLQKEVLRKDIESEKKNLERLVALYHSPININKTKDKKLRISTTVVVETAKKDEFALVRHKAASLGFTSLYNPSSIF